MYEFPGRIVRYSNAHVIDEWVTCFERVPLNRYERLSFQALTEECERLLRVRERVDGVRAAMPRPIADVHAWHLPNSRQQRDLFEATREFFEAYYSAISAVSGVVARFSAVFGRNFSDNGPMLKWARDAFEEHSHDRASELERARVFRALLAHPQQFPSYDWMTATREGYEYIHIVLFGPRGRGKRQIPPGASSEGFAGNGDWHFEAPDEVSISNCTLSLGVSVLARVWVGVAARSPLLQPIDLERAFKNLIPAHLDLGEHARGVPSKRDVDDLPPASFVPPFGP